jgi:hypothetical protein
MTRGRRLANAPEDERGRSANGNVPSPQTGLRGDAPANRRNPRDASCSAHDHARHGHATTFMGGDMNDGIKQGLRIAVAAVLTIALLLAVGVAFIGHGVAASRDRAEARAVAFCASIQGEPTSRRWPAIRARISSRSMRPPA